MLFYKIYITWSNNCWVQFSRKNEGSELDDVTSALCLESILVSISFAFIFYTQTDNDSNTESIIYKNALNLKKRI